MNRPPTTIALKHDSHLHFVTGTLAQQAVHDVVEQLSKRYGFDYSIGVMPITVAALMTPRWLAKHLQPPAEATHVIVPGFCDQSPEEIESRITAELIIGPRDCRDMGELFGERKQDIALEEHSIEIIAEINHAPRLTMAEFITAAEMLREQGADRIDIGCDPSNPCRSIASYVRELIDRQIPVSVDTFDTVEAEQACQAGASLVLSVNSSNRQQCVDWDTEVVVIPDTPTDLDSMDETIAFLSRHDIPMRLDPILEPIGAGLANSLVRYATTRQRYPELPMMMGIGNLTELTDVDSAGINVLLLGICQELGIESVLTTQVINWARTSVQECDLARRLVHAAVSRQIPPKNLSASLVMLRDPQCKSFSSQSLDALAEAIKDNNYRLFAQDQTLHVVSRQLHLSDNDPFRLFESLLTQPIADNIDAGHAFYLGYEMAKASIALTLGKQYEQDRALRWGMLTREEDLHRITRTSRHRNRRVDRE